MKSKQRNDEHSEDAAEKAFRDKAHIRTPSLSSKVHISERGLPEKASISRRGARNGGKRPLYKRSTPSLHLVWAVGNTGIFFKASKKLPKVIIFRSFSILF